MTRHEPLERPHLPRQNHAEMDGHGPHRPPRRVPRNWKTCLIIGLLIAVPLGYLWISAQQSRDSGRDKARKAEASGLTDDWPSLTQRRIYHLSIPEGATRVSFFETNGWRTSSMYVEFTTTTEKLDGFLDRVGTRGSALRDGYNPITGEQAAEVGWKFEEGDWSGVLREARGSAPDVSIAVDLAEEGKPAVRAVSTTDF